MRTRSSGSKRKAATTTEHAEPPKGKKDVATTKKQAEHQQDKGKPWYHFFTKGDEEYEHYMKYEWGFEKHGDVALFEKLCLEGAQSGLSWRTILHKREAYRRAFHHFDPVRVAQMTEQDVEHILTTQTKSPRDMVVRHRGKIISVIQNAKCVLELRRNTPNDNVDAKRDSTTDIFDYFLWSYVDHKPILNQSFTNITSLSDAPSTSPESEALSKALKKRGFKFVGPTTVYALMQSVGMVIDHPVGTPEWKDAKQRLEQRPGGYQERCQ